MARDNDSTATPEWTVSGNPDWRLEQILLDRIASDDGTRHDLDDVIAELGLVRADLLADIDFPPTIELGEN